MIRKVDPRFSLIPKWNPYDYFEMLFGLPAIGFGLWIGLFCLFVGIANWLMS